MAPREVKPTPKVQRVAAPANTTKKTVPPPSTSATRRVITKKTIDQTPVKGTVRVQGTNTVASKSTSNVPATPKPKEPRPPACPGSVTKSVKKSWQRRPKPAHSGVPVPEKMKKLLQKFKDGDLIY